jgi:hypothetical protein
LEPVRDPWTPPEIPPPEPARFGFALFIEKLLICILVVAATFLARLSIMNDSRNRTNVTEVEEVVKKKLQLVAFWD